MRNAYWAASTDGKGVKSGIILADHGEGLQGVRVEMLKVSGAMVIILTCH